VRADLLPQGAVDAGRRRRLERRKLDLDVQRRLAAPHPPGAARLEHLADLLVALGGGAGRRAAAPAASRFVVVADEPVTADLPVAAPVPTSVITATIAPTIATTQTTVPKASSITTV